MALLSNIFSFSFILFNKYRISRDNLLSNIGDVNNDGQFVTRIRDPKKRLGASLGSLSSGRVNISGKPRVLSVLLRLYVHNIPFYMCSNQ